LTDRGVRVTLDLPEDAIPQMAMLAECQRQGVALEFVAVIAGAQQEDDPRRQRALSKRN
jgi:hypothetical protein